MNCVIDYNVGSMSAKKEFSACDCDTMCHLAISSKVEKNSEAYGRVYNRLEEYIL